MEKDFSEASDCESEISRLSRFAEYYDKLLRPEAEAHANIREAMSRLNSLETSTAYPFLLAVYNSFYTGEIAIEDFKAVLGVLENYLVRRYLCGEPTNYLNKMFPTLWFQVDKSDCVQSLRGILASKNYPSDAKVRQSLFSKSLYDNNVLTRDRTTLILETINRHLSSGSGGYTVLDKSATIEHIMPQTLNPEWQNELGPNADRVHQDYLHTIGNLTLVTQEWNSVLSNAPFSIKKPKLAVHALRLNSEYFSHDLHAWNTDAIRQRSSHMTDQVLSIWPSLGEESTQNEEEPHEDAEPANFHDNCIERVNHFLQKTFIKQAKCYYATSDGTCKIVCAVSKRHSRSALEYWFSLHPPQKTFLSEGETNFVAYGCGSADKVILIPYKEFAPLVEAMWTTEDEHRHYWHVKIYENGNRFYLAQPAQGDRPEITKYLVPEELLND